MARIESIFRTPTSNDEVFAFLNRCESHLKFIPRMIELHQTSTGTFGQVGTKLSGMLRYFGVRIPVHYEIIEVEPNRQLAMQGKMGPVFFKDGYILKKSDQGTEIRFWLDLIPAGWSKVFSPFMGLIGKIHAWETLRNLERELAKHESASRRSQ
jgi:hypothetical protein